MVIGITPSLPFKGVHLLLGNDLAGDKVVVNPLVTDTPNIGQIDDPIEQEIPDLYPSCAVTRAMAVVVNMTVLAYFYGKYKRPKIIYATSSYFGNRVPEFC